MRQAEIFVSRVMAGILTENENEVKTYRFEYLAHYSGPPISLALPLTKQSYEFKKFPAFFDGLLPEGELLNALLKNNKIDSDDYFSQLVKVGSDLVGAVTVREKK